MGDVIQFIFRVLASIVTVVLLIPGIWILATPFILVGAALVGQPYFWTVGRVYRKTGSVWSDWGILMIDL